MNIIEKRDYIHSDLTQSDDKTIDKFYEKLRSALEKESVLKAKLTSRAKKSEEDINPGKFFPRSAGFTTS